MTGREDDGYLDEAARIIGEANADLADLNYEPREAVADSAGNDASDNRGGGSNLPVRSEASNALIAKLNSIFFLLTGSEISRSRNPSARNKVS